MPRKWTRADYQAMIGLKKNGEGNQKDEEEAQQVSLTIGHVSQFAREKEQKCTTEKGHRCNTE